MLAALVAVAACLPAARPVAAQGYRAWGTTRLQLVELRPIARVPVEPSTVTLDARGRGEAGGLTVFCGPDTDCFRYGAAPVERAVAGTQDVGFTAWGLGVEGLSATGLFRARADLGGALTWPRSDDAVDALLGYLQLDRGAWRFRLGRQETLSGLGFAGFDGASVRARYGVASLEAYGGRSLARALAEPRNEALRGLEDFLPDRGAWLVGGFGALRLDAGTTLGLRYQREILTDRSGLVSERASIDARTTRFAPVTFDAALDYDVAFDRWGKGHLAARWSPPRTSFLLEAEARRYVPYFALSTIWGFFSPVAYHEVTLRGSWTPAPGASLWARGGWRRYGDADVTQVLRTLESDGWRAGVGGSWRPARDWSVEGRYALEWGVGAFLSSADVAARWVLDPRLELSATATTFQQIEEFRLGDGRALGGGLSLRALLTDRAVLEGGASVLRHRPRGGQVEVDWSQLRAWTSLRIAIGEDPGLGRQGGRLDSTARVGPGEDR